MTNRTNYFKRQYWDRDRELPSPTGARPSGAEPMSQPVTPRATAAGPPPRNGPGRGQYGSFDGAEQGTTQPRLLTTKQAAAYLGAMSPRSLERWRLLGEGPRYLKIGAGKRAAVRYLTSDLDHWLSAHAYHSTSEYGRKPKQPDPEP
jgi:Helix-turn-helix domain